MCSHLPLQESVGSRRGQEYHTASGATLVNQGQRCIKAMTDDGVAVQMTYQVTDVTKPLNSVSKICDQGNSVTFNSVGGVHRELVDRGNDAVFEGKWGVRAERVGAFTKQPTNGSVNSAD